MKFQKLILISLLSVPALFACGGSGGSGGGNPSSPSSSASDNAQGTVNNPYTSVSALVNDAKDGKTSGIIYFKGVIAHNEAFASAFYFQEGEDLIVAKGSFAESESEKVNALGIEDLDSPDCLAGYEVTLKGYCNFDANYKTYAFTDSRSTSFIEFNSTRKVTPKAMEKCTYTFVYTRGSNYMKALDEYTQENKSNLSDSFQIVNSRNDMVIQFGTHGYSKSFKKMVLTLKNPVSKFTPEVSRYNRQQGNLNRYDEAASLSFTPDEHGQVVLDDKNCFTSDKHVNELYVDSFDSFYSVSFDC